ncbi:alpha/beta fold hydrolase [Leptolyngbya sp. FACHB-541]|uniref:alpha/beta fold hydrolase n=1 Tax=Leptolyngbya sp. FACHB-541 TaxID=2692810 RepID=UPI001683C629|nr:alpha/beta fold hydrolase [Leptolyngbya sp. FACHB-541]MBD1998349.1 alpha/beta fold hydrolase [Leptolyngbya sp. FACHB-541]
MQTSTETQIGAYWQWREQPIYYVRSGDRHPQRPPLLLIHGFGASTDHWRKNIEGLSRDFEVWAIDLLGFGRSAKPDWQYSGDLWRDQLHDFITNVIGQPAVLAGNSLGGYSALCVAAQRPESAVGLVLLNSAGPFTEMQLTSKPDPFRQTMGTLIQSFLLQPLPSFLLFQYVRQRWVIRRTLESVYLDKSAITDQLVEDIYRPSCDSGAAKVFASVFKSPRGEKIDVLLNQLTCPLLLLWGEGDPWMNARDRGAQFRQYYPQLMEHYLQAGHCPHDEVPDQVNTLLREWVLNLGER